MLKLICVVCMTILFYSLKCSFLGKDHQISLHAEGRPPQRLGQVKSGLVLVFGGQRKLLRKGAKREVKACLYIDLSLVWGARQMQRIKTNYQDGAAEEILRRLAHRALLSCFLFRSAEGDLSSYIKEFKVVNCVSMIKSHLFVINNKSRVVMRLKFPDGRRIVLMSLGSGEGCWA